MHVKPDGWDVPQRIADPKVRSAAAITVPYGARYGNSSLREYASLARPPPVVQ